MSTYRFCLFYMGLGLAALDFFSWSKYKGLLYILDGSAGRRVSCSRCVGGVGHYQLVSWD